MRSPLRSFTLVALMLASVASAQQYKRPLKKAADALDDAARASRRGGPQCKQAVYETLDQLAEQADDLKKDARPRDVVRLKFEVWASRCTATAG